MKSGFAVRMKNLRHERGLSQRQAAAQFDISQAVLSHYENGSREPKFEFVLQACDFYSVTADYLLGRTDERKSGAEILSRKVSEIITSIEVLKREENELIEMLSELVEL